MTKISVIIPTYNAAGYFPKMLDALKTQTAEFELLIIDSSSADDTVAIAQQYTDNITVIPQSEFDHGGTRAKAAQMASGDILVFLTQDALPRDEQTVEKIVQIFDDENIGAAYGRQISYPETNLFGTHLRLFNYPDGSYIRSRDDIGKYGIKTGFLSDSFAAYRQKTLEEIGWFKSGLILGEDTYAGAKMILAGHKLAYVSDAQVYHSHDYTIWQEFKRYFDIGVFHECEKWILQEFGKAEGEGMKYIKSELRYLLDNGAWYMVPSFFLRNGFKYMGYKLGRKHKSLSPWMIRKCSMHYRWFNKI